MKKLIVPLFIFSFVTLSGWYSGANYCEQSFDNVIVVLTGIVLALIGWSCPMLPNRYKLLDIF